MSAFPASAVPSKSGFNVPIPNSSHANVEQYRDVELGQISYGAAAVSSIQFVLGAWLWLSGQQVGSISCTGLGYWVVFDSFGVALTKVIPGWLASRSSNRPHLLLSSGEGHHHRQRDGIEGLGIDFPIFMILVIFILLLGTANCLRK
ncbi:hypothetical protein BYT27DRAFT_7261427 [Phlegmacium glaucopus]|nr:hypothetical protein BYT27DRAFT_7261427 [Phlegmacium glaucopus]